MCIIFIKLALVGLIEAIVSVGKGKLTIDHIAALILQLSRQLPFCSVTTTWKR